MTPEAENQIVALLTEMRDDLRHLRSSAERKEKAKLEQLQEMTDAAIRRVNPAP